MAFFRALPIELRGHIFGGAPARSTYDASVGVTGVSSEGSFDTPTFNATTVPTFGVSERRRQRLLKTPAL